MEYYLKMDMEKLPSIRFAHTFLTDNYSFSSRILDSIEIVYFDKGVWSVWIEGYVSVNANPGDIVIIPPGIPISVHINPEYGIHEHSCINFALDPDSKMELMNRNDLMNYTFLIDSERFDNMKNRSVIMPLYINNAVRYEFMIKEIISEFILIKPGYRMNTSSRLCLLMSMMTSDVLDEFYNGHDSRSVPPMHHIYCKRIMEYIEQHYSDKVTISAIAKEIGINPYYMCSIFKQATGDTIIGSLNRTRIEKSKDMLVSTDDKIADICKAAGFENEHYFNKVFKKYEGMTPGRFRSVSFNNLSGGHIAYSRRKRT